MVGRHELQLYLGGHLSWYDSQKRKRIDVRLTKPTLLTNVLSDLHVPIGEIAVGVVNGNSVFAFDGVTVTDADKVELFPPVGGG